MLHFCLSYEYHYYGYLSIEDIRAKPWLCQMCASIIYDNDQVVTCFSFYKVCQFKHVRLEGGETSSKIEDGRTYLNCLTIQDNVILTFVSQN